MKITVLVDNQPHSGNSALEAEHGLSFYIEIGQHKLLLDVGASDKFLRNAQRLGIDIDDVDYLILSHAHSDHTGGLECFLQNNAKARIYFSSNISDAGYFSDRSGLRRDISIDYRLLAEHHDRFVSVADNTFLTDQIQIITKISNHHALPKANSTLFCGGIRDSFNHEIAVLLSEDRQRVLLSSCTHLGLLNTLEACSELPQIFIGGLHLPNADADHSFETDSNLQALAQAIRSNYPTLQIHTGHCTGATAVAALTKLLPTQFHTFHTGLRILHNYKL